MPCNDLRFAIYSLGVSFDQIFKAWHWKPIRNCPGRFVLREAMIDLPMERIIGDQVEVSCFEVSGAKDRVLVARLDGGGIISYRRDNGSFVHTLNTTEGFARKLRQLGIELPDGSN